MASTRRMLRSSLHAPSLGRLLQALHNDNVSLKAEIQNLQAQISEQVSEGSFFLKATCVTVAFCLTHPSLSLPPSAFDCTHAGCLPTDIGPVSEKVCMNRNLKKTCIKGHAHIKWFKKKKKENTLWIKFHKTVNIYWSTFLRSAREKEENMKTVESLLEKGLIEVANKEEELKVRVWQEVESEPERLWLIAVL